MRQLPRHDLDFVDRATVVARATREVAATREAIWTELADSPSWPEWLTVLGRARWLSVPPHGVGSRREVTLGPLTVEEEFIAWDVEERFAFSFVGIDGPGNQPTTGGVEVVELRPGTVGHTVVTYTIALGLRGPSSVLQPLVAPVVQLVLGQGLARLERRVAA